MADTRDLTVRLKGDTSDFERSMGRVNGLTETGRLSFLKLSGAVAVGNAAFNLAVQAVQSLSSEIGNAVNRVDTLNNANRTFENLGFKASDVKEAMSALDQSVRGLPTPLNEAVKGMTLIASSTNDITKSQQVFSALNDAVIGFGGTTADVSNAVTQLSQDLAGGRISAQTWDSMLNSGLGPTLNAMARQMGITTGALKDGLSTGKISVDKFQDALVNLDKNGGGGMKSLHTIAQDATGGISTSIENAKTAVTRGIADIIQAIGSAKIAKAISDVGTGLEIVMQALSGGKISTSNKDMQNFATTITNLRDILLKDIIPAVDNFTGRMIYLGERVYLFLKPSLDALFSTVMKDLYPALMKLWKEVIEPLAPVVGVILVAAIWLLVNVLNIMIKSFSASLNAVSDFLGFLIRLPGEINRVFNGIGSWLYNAGRDLIQGLINGVMSMVGAVANAVKGVGSSAVNAIKGALGIHSPSTVFAEIGSYMGQGLVQGLQGELGNVQGATVQMAGGSAQAASSAATSTSAPVAPSQSVSITVAPQIGIYAGMPVEKRQLAVELWLEIVRAARAQGVQLPNINVPGVQV